MSTKHLLSSLSPGSNGFALLTLGANATCCAPPQLFAQTDPTGNADRTEAVHLNIDGVNCNSCAASIDAALHKGKIAIGFEQQGGTVAYTPAKVDKTTVVETVNQTSFTAIVSNI